MLTIAQGVGEKGVHVRGGGRGEREREKETEREGAIAKERLKRRWTVVTSNVKGAMEGGEKKREWRGVEKSGNELSGLPTGARAMHGMQCDAMRRWWRKDKERRSGCK